MSSVHNVGSVVNDCSSVMFISWNLHHLCTSFSIGRRQMSQGTIWGVWIVQDTSHAIIYQKFLHKTEWVGALFWWSSRSPMHHLSGDFHHTSYCKYWFISLYVCLSYVLLLIDGHLKHLASLNVVISVLNQSNIHCFSCVVF
jgi:hypothetical protein